METEITEDVVEEVVEEVIEEEVEEKVEETEEVKETPEKPPWLLDVDDKMPVASHLKVKRKLKGEVEEGRVENEELKDRIKALESQTTTQPKSQPLKRPRERDFETDDEYYIAIDEYEEKRYNSITNNLTQTNTQRNQQDQIQQDTDKKVVTHYEKAAEFVKQTGIDPDVYKAADSNVRQAVEAVRPRQGNQSVDFLISRLGDDSEKVMLRVGSNKKLLEAFQTSLVRDPTGLEAGILLGRQQEIIQNANKKTSLTPKPAAHANGGKTPPAKTTAHKKKYDKAAETDNWQEAFNIKQAAKKAGVDTKEWS